MIFPPRPPQGRGLGRRALLSLPDLALGGLFLSAWLNVAGVAESRGIDLMLVVEIEGWTLVVTLLTGAFAYSLSTGESRSERIKDIAWILALCAIPPVYFAWRWHLLWPVGVFAWLLWNRLRGVAARVPSRELFLYAAAAWLSMWLSIPQLGAAGVPFRIADYPGWCHAPEFVVPNSLREDGSVVTWCAEPHRALAAGTFYFFVTGLLTLWRGPYRLSLLWGWVRRDPEE